METPNFSEISEERRALRGQLRDSGISAPDALVHPALQSDPTVQALKQLNTEAAAFRPQDLTGGKEILRNLSAETPGAIESSSPADLERARVAGAVYAQAKIEERITRAQYLLLRNPNNPNLQQQIQRGEALKIHAQQERKSLESNPNTAPLVRDAVLSQYQESLDQGNFVVTPSRQEYIQKIQAAIERGEPVLLEGHTGTGKSEIARIAAQQLTGRNPEVVSCKPSTRPSDIWGKQGLRAEAGVAVTKIDYGPLTRAMQSGSICVFDEFNEMDPRERQQLKWLYNVKPSQEVDIPGNGKVTVQSGFGLVMTANLKSDKYQAKQSLEPQEARVFATSAYTVEPMPQSEVYDVALATLREPDGSLPLSQSEATTTLKHLCDAVAEIQKAYGGQVGAHYQAQMATGKKAALKDYTLDTGIVVRMLQGYSHEKLRDPKLPLQKYLDQKLIQTLASNLYTESDKKFAAFLLASKGFLATIPNPALEMRVEYAAGEALNPALWPKSAEMPEPGSLARDRVNALDPYHQRVIQAADVLGNFGISGPEARNTSHELGETSLAECESIFTPERLLGPMAFLKTYGEMPKEIPEIPFTTEYLKERAKEGYALVLLQSEFQDGTPMTMQNVKERLGSRQHDGTSNLLHDTDWYQAEEFYTTATSESKWVLMQTQILPDSTSKTYAQQTDLLVADLQAEFTKSKLPMPLEYQEALAQYAQLSQEQKAALTSEEWTKLKATQLLRHSTVELLQFLALDNRSNERAAGQNVLKGVYSRGKDRASGGFLVLAGYLDSSGALVDGFDPSAAFSDIGVLPSRSVGL
jgi:MoxR-like ATPase